METYVKAAIDDDTVCGGRLESLGQQVGDWLLHAEPGDKKVRHGDEPQEGAQARVLARVLARDDEIV
jgi:hypothetical protein